jgi:hypothetical protein
LLTISTSVSYIPVWKLKTVRNFNNAAISHFINILSNESWDTVFNNEDVNDMYNSFSNYYLRIFNLSFPLQTVMIRKNPTNNKWITKGIKIPCNNERKLYLACRHHNIEEIKRYSRIYSNILANVIREVKKIYYNKKILRSNNKYKTTWDIVKEVSGHQHPTINIKDIKVANKHIIDQQEIAEVFNDYLIFKKEKVHKYKVQNRLNDVTSRNCYSNNNDIHPSSSFIFKTFLTKEISSIVKSVKTKTSHGYDGISTKILKVSFNYIILPLTYICNKVIVSGVFLD